MLSQKFDTRRNFEIGEEIGEQARPFTKTDIAEEVATAMDETVNAEKLITGVE